MKFDVLKIMVFFILSFAVHKVQAQVEVAAAVDSTNMLIGDQLKLHITASVPANASIQKLDLSAFEAEKEMEVVKEGAWDTVQQNGMLHLQKDLTFTIFDTGYYWVPELPLSYLQNGQSGVVKTQRIPINVGTVQLVADSTQIELAPIKDIIREQANWRDYLPLILAFLSFAAVVGIFYFVNKRKNQVNLPPPPKVIIPAHEKALTALQQLKSEQLWQKGEIKAYQSKLTHIIREYLENRYEIPALESTTDEIQRSLKKVDFDASWKEKLSNILQVADLVKFAKAEPPADFHERVWEEAENFVLATKKVPVVEKEVG